MRILTTGGEHEPPHHILLTLLGLALHLHPRLSFGHVERQRRNQPTMPAKIVRHESLADVPHLDDSVSSAGGDERAGRVDGGDNDGGGLLNLALVYGGDGDGGDGKVWGQRVGMHLVGLGDADNEVGGVGGEGEG